MKLEPKKIFVLQDGKYIELSYQEFQKIDVKEGVFLPLYGMLMEVSKEVYKDFYRHMRRQKYIVERAAKMGEVSYHALMTDETNGEEILKDPAEGVDLQAEKHTRLKIMSLRATANFTTRCRAISVKSCRAATGKCWKR